MVEGYYFLWDGVGGIETVEDAVPLTDTPARALEQLKSKSQGDWTLWLSQGIRAVLVAVWRPRRKELVTFPIDCGELDRPLTDSSPGTPPGRR